MQSEWIRELTEDEINRYQDQCPRKISNGNYKDLMTGEELYPTDSLDDFEQLFTTECGGVKA